MIEFLGVIAARVGWAIPGRHDRLVRRAVPALVLVVAAAGETAIFLAAQG